MRRVSSGINNRGPNLSQIRTLYIKQFQALDMLKGKSIPVNETAASTSDSSLSITIDRTALSPCIIVSPGLSPGQTSSQPLKFPFGYMTTTLTKGTPYIYSIASHLRLPATFSVHVELAALVEALWQIFKEKEAFLLETRINLSLDGTLEVRGARFGFDDAAFKSSGRQEDVHQLRAKRKEVWEEVEAEKDGIVYVK